MTDGVVRLLRTIAKFNRRGELRVKSKIVNSCATGLYTHLRFKAKCIWEPMERSVKGSQMQRTVYEIRVMRRFKSFPVTAST